MANCEVQTVSWQLLWLDNCTTTENVAISPLGRICTARVGERIQVVAVYWDSMLWYNLLIHSSIESDDGNEFNSRKLIKRGFHWVSLSLSVELFLEFRGILYHFNWYGFSLICINICEHFALLNGWIFRMPYFVLIPWSQGDYNEHCSNGCF